MNRVDPGFTLVELLVALAILSIAGGAFLHATSVHSRNSSQLEGKTFAHWIALNRITEIQIRSGWPKPGSHRGQSNMVNRQWYWLQTISSTPNPNIRRIHIEVATSPNAAPLTSLSGHLAKP